MARVEADQQIAPMARAPTMVRMPAARTDGLFMARRRFGPPSTTGLSSGHSDSENVCSMFQSMLPKNYVPLYRMTLISDNRGVGRSSRSWTARPCGSSFRHGNRVSAGSLSAHDRVYHERLFRPQFFGKVNWSTTVPEFASRTAA